MYDAALAKYKDSYPIPDGETGRPAPFPGSLPMRACTPDIGFRKNEIIYSLGGFPDKIRIRKKTNGDPDADQI